MKIFLRVLNAASTSRAAARDLMPTVIVLILFGGLAFAAESQNVVTLPQLVIQRQRTEYVSTENAGTPNIIDVKSSNPSVATATVYRVSQVQIVAKARGKTDVEFFDASQRVLYRVAVWVEDAKAGAGGGYDPRKTQLDQVVMLVKYTHNVTVPGDGRHQLSSVVSSNPSVATARTNTQNTIQIYSVALGDTFVDFTDNATGTTYQVHVWVVKNLSDPIGGNNPSGGGTKAASNPKAKPKPMPSGGEGKGALDACVVGTWRSESVVDKPGLAGKRGGAGIVMTIKGDGTITMDYNQMQALEAEAGGIGEKNWWRGTASGRISTSNGVATVVSVEKSDVSRKFTDPQGKTTTNPIGKLGPAALGTNPEDNSYKCDQTTLTRTTPNQIVTFKREKNKP
jgi:Pilus formation protein N terminal region